MLTFRNGSPAAVQANALVAWLGAPEDGGAGGERQRDAARLRSLFDHLDSDSNGRLDAREVARMAEKAGTF